MSEPTLSINCFLLGSDPRNVVTVNILKTENVCVLKELIKEKLASHLNHVRSASDLAVWKVSIPVDAITPELTVDDVELHSVKKISSIFREALVDEHVHILVQVQGPTGALHKCFLDSSSHFLKRTGVSQLPILRNFSRSTASFSESMRSWISISSSQSRF